MAKERSLVLVCDDDALVRYSVIDQLRSAGYEMAEAADGIDCLDKIVQMVPAVVVLDLAMPRMDGLTVLKTLREGDNSVPVVVFTSSRDVDSAIEATRLGAVAYLQKPLDPRELALTVDRVLAEDRLKQEVYVLRNRERAGLGEFIGRSEALAPLFTDLRRLETVNAPTVLILGESGTGKDVVARMIHSRGPRKEAMFVEVDCTSLSENLVESELFGHEKGAFTDAKTSKRGLFEVAAGGVVFLDEIGELPLSMQAKLLRAIENRTFKRVGGVASLKLDAGVIAATNRDLRKEVAEGRFREDLYYRLNVVTLRIPPLRERKDDIPMLAEHFLTRFNQRFGRTGRGEAIEGIEGEAMARMLTYSWPGNVRELKNILERIAILGGSGRVGLDDLPPEIRFVRDDLPASDSESGVPGCPFDLPDSGIVLDRVERGFVIQALRRTRGNRTAAAGLLGISRFQLRTRIERYELGDQW